jgi:hypothetical protein
MYNGVEIVCRYFLIQYLKITVVTEIYFVRYRTVVVSFRHGPAGPDHPEATPVAGKKIFDNRLEPILDPPVKPEDDDVVDLIISSFKEKIIVIRWRIRRVGPGR